MQRKEIKIGLFGLGCVGQGLYDVLKQTPGMKAEIKKVCVKDPNKIRKIPSELITFDKFDILNDDDINVVVELIDDSDAAFEITQDALIHGKGVVSANKKMIAENFADLLTLQAENKSSFLYEGAACASIPIIRNLEEYYDTDLLQSVVGIVNGSTNYILTKIFQNNQTFDIALKQAQELGFAESNPALDIEGYDAKYKLTILLAHSFGIQAQTRDIFNLGISRINDLDAKFAREKGFKIKLLASAKKVNDNPEISAFVLPTFVRPNDKFFNVDDVFNGVETEGCFADKQFFVGKGAGAYPTASAVLSDISALSYDYKYEYKKIHQSSEAFLTNDFEIDLFVSTTQFDFDVQNLKKDFIQINEEFTSSSGSYLIGKINFQILINSEWCKEKSYSLISLNV